MKDINAPKLVEITVSTDGKRLWINVDGICELRVTGMAQYRIEDPAIDPRRKGGK